MSIHISPAVAAKVMGKNVQFVRIGLQRGLLPFGVAQRTDVNKSHGRYNYYISPGKFMEFTGATKEDIISAMSS